MHIGVGFFDFIQQQHAEGLLVYRFSEQSALLKANVAGRCTDETSHGVAFHVFRHIETLQWHTQNIGKLAGDFGFAHAGGSGKQEAANRLFCRPQTGTGHLNGGSQCLDSSILAEHHVFQVALQMAQHFFVVFGYGLLGNAGNFGHHFFNLRGFNHFAPFVAGQDALGGGGFVNQVDGLIGQEAVIQVAYRKLGGGIQGVLGKADLVEVFERGLQAFQDFHGFGHAGLGHVDFLETSA